MKRQHIAGIYASPETFGGQTLTVCGWARTIRDMKNFGFIELNDGSCFKSLQVVLERGKLENYDEIARQNVGAAFIVRGELVLTPDAKQPFELKADSVTVEGVSAPGIAESPVNIACRVVEERALGSHTMFLAEVVGVTADEKYMDETGRFDINGTGLIMYSHGEYFGLGRKLGKFGYSVQKKKPRRRAK